MNIGFFGGSFDPPHKGHIHSANVFCKEAGLSLLYIIPTHVSPFKKDKNDVCSDSDRLRMCELAFSEISSKNTCVNVSNIETKRSGTSYTVDTVNKLSALHPNDTLFMFVGSDMFLSLERWKDFKTLFDKCVIYTRARYDGDIQSLEETAAKYKEKYGARILISLDKEFICSSTEVRKSISQNNILNIKNLLTEKVFGYIIENNLYLRKKADEQ